MATSMLLRLASGGARVSGQVLDGSGGPIDGAVVMATDAAGNVESVGLSEGGGAFQLDVPSGVARLIATADGYSEGARGVRAPIDGVQLVLAVASSIAGRVIADGSRMPVPDVLVTAVGSNGIYAQPRAERTLEDGTFEFAGLPAGRYSLTAASEHWRGDERAISVGVSEASEPVELLVRPAIRLSGRVTVDDEPCTSGAVSLNGPIPLYSPVAADGSVSFDGLPPGQYESNVSCVGALSRVEPLDVALVPMHHDWDLDRGLVLTGTALTADDSPLPHTQVDMRPVGEPSDRADVYCLSDERGEFACGGLQPGQYDCTLGAGVPARSDTVRVRVEAGDTQHLRLHAHAEGQIRVRVENADSWELPALAIVARREPETLVAALEGKEFVFSLLPLGTYEVSTDPATADATQRVELTRHGQTVELTLPLPASHTLSGRVVDDQGQPLPDVWVKASGAAVYARPFSPSPVLTDGDGAFSLPGLLPGRYQLSATSKDGEARLEDVPSEAENVTVRLARYGSLSGAVTTARGDVVDDFVLAFTRGDEPEQSIRGGQGRWTLPWLEPGTYMLSAKAPGGRASQSVHVQPGADLQVTLQLDAPGTDPDVH